jgi:O-antigen ligase
MRRKISAFLRLLLFAGLLFLMVFTPLAYGAVEKWAFSIMVIVAGAMFIVWGVKVVLEPRRKEQVPFWRRNELVLLAFGSTFILLIAFQILPLPFSQLKTVTPFTASLISRIAPGPGQGLPEKAAISVYPHLTRLELGKLLAYLAVFVIVMKEVRTRKDLLWICVPLIAIAAVEAFHGLIQTLLRTEYTFLYPSDYFSHSTAHGTFVSNNHFAGYLEMIAPLALSLLLVEATEIWKGEREIAFRWGMIRDFFNGIVNPRGILLLLCLVLMATGIFFSRSRTGVLSFVGSIVVFAFFFFGKKTTWRDGLILLVLLCVVFFFSYKMGYGRVADKYRDLMDKGIRQTPRYYVWNRTVDMIRAFPFFGSGLGTYRFASRRWIPSSFYYAHNDYLNLASDAGLIGFGLAAAAISFWGFMILAAKRRIPSAFRRIMLAGPLAGVTALLLHSVADFNLQLPANALHFAMLLGLGGATLHLKEGDRHGYEAFREDSDTAYHPPPWRIACPGGPSEP